MSAGGAEQVPAFPDTKAARLAHVSIERLRRWEEADLVVPSIKETLSPRNTVRLYCFQDLLALLVVAELRTERDMSLQHIRKVVNHLRSRGYEHPLRELKFATLGKHIYFQHPDGSWEGDIRPDQIVLEKVLKLDPLRARIGAAASRPEDAAGHVVRKRRVHASVPVFEGTRIRVATVQAYLQNGYSTAAILQAFPDLRAADIEQARNLLAAPG
jgi:DNA-binding transcriptional MerR regulator